MIFKIFWSHAALLKQNKQSNLLNFTQHKSKMVTIIPKVKTVLVGDNIQKIALPQRKKDLQGS